MALRLVTICFSILILNIIALCLVEGYGSSRRSKVVAETIHGDIYDCVDIYKQPSLLHPILDKERIKMTIAKELEKQRLLKAKQLQKDENIYFKAEEYWLNKKDCPIGTVPIRRMTQEQLQSAKDTSLNLANEYLADNTIDFAGISIKASPEINRFTGASSIITLYNPQVRKWTRPIQFRNNISSKWRKCNNYKLDGLYIQNYTVTDGLDSILAGQRPPENWMLQYNLSRICSKYYLQLATMFAIGFWHDTLFKELRNGSETVRFGGKAYTPAGETVSPPMGNGQFQADNLHLTCHMRQVMYGVDIDEEVQPHESLVQTHRSRCYCEGKENNARDGYWDYNFLFGGAGNCTDSPITCT